MVQRLYVPVLSLSLIISLIMSLRLLVYMDGYTVDMSDKSFCATMDLCVVALALRPLPVFVILSKWVMLLLLRMTGQALFRMDWNMSTIAD